MKCKIIFETKPVVPTFEDFEKVKDYEGQSHYDIVHKICDNQVYLNQSGYLLTSDNDCYKFEYWKPSIIIENSFYSNLTFSFIDKLKPMLKNSLTFNTLRKANIARIPEFKNSKGKPAHSKADGSDWSPADWLGAVLGELGEYANIMKKVKRGDFTFEEAKPLIEKELADAQIYLDILAFRVGVDLAKATENKFNEVSERVGCSLRIENNEVVRKGISGKCGVDSKDYDKIGGFNSPQDIYTRLEAIQKCGMSTLENYNYNSKSGELTPKKEVITKLQETSEKLKAMGEDCETVKKPLIKSLELIKEMNRQNQEFWNNRYGLSKQELFVKKSFSSSIGGALDEMVRWKLFRNYAEIYPLKIPRRAIDDIFSFEFQGIDNGKQYLFYYVKQIFHARQNCSLQIRGAITLSCLFEYFSKQLNTKITGMLINGSREITTLNSGDLIQFHDDRNVLYNLRLVKSSDKNIEMWNSWEIDLDL